MKTILVSLACIFFLLLCILASITCGTRSVGFENIVGALSGSDAHEAHVIAARIPRTVFGILAGAALAVSGALMQAVTRNPIADPSILGVNTGASLFVVCGIAFFHINTGSQYIWLAFTGASATAVFVYGLASFGYGGATPLKLALAGAAAGTALQSLVNTVMLPRTQVMDQFRFWQTGSISGASWNDIRLILPYLAAGFILSLLLAPSLNTLALGDDTAAGLGLHVTRTRSLAALAGVLLCAASTALAGPIGFIGLMIPHLMRLLLGPDMRKILPLSAVGGSCLLLLADVAGRILGRPGELESGIVTALAGAPVFILIIRKVKVRSL
ncbi:FecCD family ABC transporter permease [[Clostridium] hylemonae]|uniref:FecCD family ABC transporter permease n=1 Tax=[Clostridium] hylemonae TaxID=89153 RepID=UPI001A9B0E6E|nr:iron ABC transporter permease [[Clostridium] hylemonae]